MNAEHSARKNNFTADGGPHKTPRILVVADGLRRIGEFESAEMLLAYADLLDRQAAGVTDEVLRNAERVFDATSNGIWRFGPGNNWKASLRAALLAVWPVAAEPACKACGAPWPNYAIDPNPHTCTAEPVAQGEAEKLYVEARQCDNCDHLGLNDASETESACHNCCWHGPEPIEDKCPGCGSENCMYAACPECGNRYSFLTDRHFTMPVTPSAQPRAVPEGAPEMSEMSEVWVVQDETGLPIYCASYPEACHEHINEAINEHGIEEAKAWKVLRFGNYVFVPCRQCNSTRVAVAAPSQEPQS